MATAPAPGALTDTLSAILCGENVVWDDLGISASDFLAACTAEDVVGLAHERLTALPIAHVWPQSLRDELTARSRAAIARELWRRRELLTVLDALAQAGVHPILLKGTALAYTVYASPASRPRHDTDLLVRHQDLDAARDAMAAIGYVAPPYCDGDFLFHQFVLTRDDRFGVEHVFDVHWKISTQSVFADLLTYDELAAHSLPVPALATHARTAGPLHALLLACVHPVMHHRNLERLIWLYDIHLLASRVAAQDLDRFADMALAKGVGPICARELARARSRLGTSIPDHVILKLASEGNEALSGYLQPGRRWHHEFLSNLRGLDRWSDRFRLMREVLIPSTRYMLGSYGLANQPYGFALLPALYLHRNLRGLWNVMVGRK